MANLHGYPVVRLPLVKQKELEVDGYICIADRLGPDESRWYIAHALGHKMMHPGNHLWIYKKTMLGYRYEREAHDFAHTLLTNDREAIGEGLTCSLEVGATILGCRKSSSGSRRRWNSARGQSNRQ